MLEISVNYIRVNLQSAVTKAQIFTIHCHKNINVDERIGHSVYSAPTSDKVKRRRISPSSSYPTDCEIIIRDNTAYQLTWRYRSVHATVPVKGVLTLWTNQNTDIQLIRALPKSMPRWITSLISGWSGARKRTKTAVPSCHGSMYGPI